MVRFLLWLFRIRPKTNAQSSKHIRPHEAYIPKHTCSPGVQEAQQEPTLFLEIYHAGQDVIKIGGGSVKTDALFVAKTGRLLTDLGYSGDKLQCAKLIAAAAKIVHSIFAQGWSQLLACMIKLTTEKGLENGGDYNKMVAHVTLGIFDDSAVLFKLGAKRVNYLIELIAQYGCGEDRMTTEDLSSVVATLREMIASGHLSVVDLLCAGSDHDCKTYVDGWLAIFTAMSDNCRLRAAELAYKLRDTFSEIGLALWQPEFDEIVMKSANSNGDLRHVFSASVRSAQRMLPELWSFDLSLLLPPHPLDNSQSEPDKRECIGEFAQHLESPVAHGQGVARCMFLLWGLGA